MPSDWHSGLYAGCFGIPNTREYEGEITITKRWLDADGKPITDSSKLPIPVVHVDTEEPVIDLPPQDAYVQSGYTLRSRLSNATTFQKTTRSYTRDSLPPNAERVDDRRTRAAIFVWLEGTDAYWWSDAATAHLPNYCYALFQVNSSLKTVDLSGFDTSNVTNMQYMFYNCSNLTTLDVSGWDTGSVTNMYAMFSGCRELTTLDLSGWDTGSVTNMSEMFYGCSNLTTLNLSGWKTGSVINMRYMFRNCSSLTSLDVSGWDTGSVKDMSSMFNFCSGLTTLDLSGWDTGSVTNMYGMFAFCNNLTTLNLSGWDNGSVTNMSDMFSYCGNLTTLDLSGWDTGSVTTMSGMFRQCSCLTTLDLSGWDTGSVTNMSSMFQYCYNLTTLNLSGWDTGSVTNMRSMFSSCESLKTVYVGDLWSTEKVNSSGDMLYCCFDIVGEAGTTYNYYLYPSDKTYARVDNPPDEPGYFTYKKYVPPTGNKDDEPVGATLNNVLGGLIKARQRRFR